jgi:hypothetical protein
VAVVEVAEKVGVKVKEAQKDQDLQGNHSPAAVVDLERDDRRDLQSLVRIVSFIDLS